MVLPTSPGPRPCQRCTRCRCKEIYVKKSTLDDVFLNLTGATLAGKVS